ncbi:MAG: hypothetical protein OEV87_06655 [Phycisphaerae bacterium]|nr:hypothetical protein [Phycisphaerae bacterium]
MKMIFGIKKLFLLAKFYFKLHGFIGGVKFAYGLLRSGVEIIYIFKPALDKIKIELINPKLTFRLIQAPDQFDLIYNDYSEIRGDFFAQEDKRRMRSKKEWLAIIYKDEILAGWGWVKFGCFTYGTNKVTEKDCIIHKCRTVRSIRRQRVYVTLLVKLLNDLKEKKVQKVYIGAKDFNYASLKAIDKIGFRRIEEYNSGNIFQRINGHIQGHGTKVIS